MLGALQERLELSQRWVHDGWEHTVTRTAYLIHTSSLYTKVYVKTLQMDLGSLWTLVSPEWQH